MSDLRQLYMRVGKNRAGDIVPKFVEINRGRQQSGVLSLKSYEKGAGVNRLGQKQNSKVLARNLFDLDVHSHSTQLKRKHSGSSKQLFAKAHSTQKGQTFLRPKVERSVSDFKPSLMVSEPNQPRGKEWVPQQMSQMLSLKLKDAQRDRKTIMKQVLADLQKRESKLVIRREYGRLKEERSLFEQSMIKNKAVSQVQARSKPTVEQSKEQRQVEIRQLLAQSVMLQRQSGPSVQVGGEQMLRTIKEAIRSNMEDIYLQKDRRLEQRYESKQRQLLERFSKMERVIGERLESERNMLMESISSLHKKEEGLGSVGRGEKLQLAAKSRVDRDEGQKDDVGRVKAKEESERKPQAKREVGKLEKQTKKDTDKRDERSQGQFQIEKAKRQSTPGQSHKNIGMRPQPLPKELQSIFEQPMESEVFRLQQQVKFIERDRGNKAAVPPPEKMKLKQYPKEPKHQRNIFDRPNDTLDDIEEINLNCQSKIIPQTPKHPPKVEPKPEPRNNPKQKDQPQPPKNNHKDSSKERDKPPAVLPSPKETKQQQKQPSTPVIPPKPANQPPSLQQKQQVLRKRILQFQSRDSILGSIGCVAGLCSQNCKQSKLQWRLPALLTYRYVLDCFLDQIPFYEQAEKLGLIGKAVADSFFADFEKMQVNLQKMLKAFTKKGVVSEVVRGVVVSEKNEMYRLRPMILQEVGRYVRELRGSEELRNLAVLQCGLTMINAVFLIRQIGEYPNERGLPGDFDSYDLERSLSVFGEWSERLLKLL